MILRARKQIWEAVAKRLTTDWLHDKETCGLCAYLTWTTTCGEDNREYPRLLRRKPHNANAYWWTTDTKRGYEARLRVCRLLAQPDRVRKRAKR